MSNEFKCFDRKNFKRLGVEFYYLKKNETINKKIFF